jgi:hypothetical protein
MLSDHVLLFVSTLAELAILGIMCYEAWPTKMTASSAAMATLENSRPKRPFWPFAVIGLASAAAWIAVYMTYTASKTNVSRVQEVAPPAVPQAMRTIVTDPDTGEISVVPEPRIVPLTYSQAVALLNLEHSVQSLNGQCSFKVSATRENQAFRSVLINALTMNTGCKPWITKLDADPDSFRDLDAPPTPSPVGSGLTLRWSKDFSNGEQIANWIDGNGFKIAGEGHAMPPDSPPNLMWIQIGDGSPWK